MTSGGQRLRLSCSSEPCLVELSSNGYARQRGPGWPFGKFLRASLSNGPRLGRGRAVHRQKPGLPNLSSGSAARAVSGRRALGAESGKVFGVRMGALSLTPCYFTLRNFASRIRSEFAASRIRANSRAKESGRSRSRIPAREFTFCPSVLRKIIDELPQLLCKLMLRLS